MGAPAVGTVVDGYRFNGGNHRDRANWTQVAPIDVSGQWGDGARQLPNGDIVRYGPRGGMSVIAQAQGADAKPEIREFEANAAARATLMDQGQINYDRAVAAGYDPTSWRNGLARRAEDVWLVGQPLANAIRDDAADRGRAAELQFTDGALRTTTGANAPEPEVVRADRSYFRQPGESASVEPDKAELRRRFRDQAVRIAGDAYIEPPRAQQQRQRVQSRTAEQSRYFQANPYDRNAPQGSRSRPYAEFQGMDWRQLPGGSFFVDQAGVLRTVPARDAQNERLRARSRQSRTGVVSIRRVE